MITAIVGAFLGVSGLRFWWQGLAALVVVAIVLPIISTSLALQFNPLSEQVDLRPANLARVTTIQFLSLLFWYGVGVGVHWLFNRRKKQHGDDQAA
jgi:hypothetical protein